MPQRATYADTRHPAVTRLLSGLPSELACSDRSSVGADLSPGGSQLGGIEAEREDRSGAFGLGCLHEPFLCVYAAFGEHLRHPLQLSAHQRLQRGADLRAEVA